MENVLFEKCRKLLKWETIDGTMTPGGSSSNFMGIHMARYNAFPDIKQKGMYGKPLMKVFTSNVSHYSIKKGVNLCGMGIDNIVMVKTD